MPAQYIPDGYTRERLLEGGGPPVRILYRPMLAEERRRLNREIVRRSARGDSALAGAVERMVSAVAERVVDWDLCNAGRPVEISSESVAALEPALFEQVCSIVMTFDDEGPSAKN